MVTRADFLATVESFIGTPVKHFGRVPQQGMDCAGVVLAALANLGVAVADFRYRRFPDAVTLVEGLRVNGFDRIAPEDAVPGDLLQVYVGNEPRHVMVLTAVNDYGQRVAVHAYGRGKRVGRSIVHERVAAAWRLRGMVE